MNKEAIEHRDRLKVLENTMGTTYYETGHLHLAISDAMEKYHKDKLNLLTIQRVSQQRELLLAYHKHLDSFNDPTIYNATESMIDDYLANNCG